MKSKRPCRGADRGGPGRVAVETTVCVRKPEPVRPQTPWRDRGPGSVRLDRFTVDDSKFQRNSWKSSLAGLKKSSSQGGRQRRGHAEADGTVGFSSAGAHNARQLLHKTQYRGCFPVEHLTGRGRTHAARTAFEGGWFPVLTQVRRFADSKRVAQHGSSTQRGKSFLLQRSSRNNANGEA